MRARTGPRILAHAAGEDDGVGTAQCRHQRGRVARGGIAVVVHRLDRLRPVARQQHAHVGRNAGEAEKPALAVEQVFKLVEAQMLVAHQRHQHAGVDGAGARAHDEAVGRREAHGGGNALAVEDRAHRGARAQMRGKQAARQRLARQAGQGIHHMLIVQAVEAVAAVALVEIGARQRKPVWQVPAAWHGRPCRSRRCSAPPAPPRRISRSTPRPKGRCSGASARSASRSCWMASFTATGVTYCVPPCTMRWPMPLNSAGSWPLSDSHSAATSSPSLGVVTCGTSRAAVRRPPAAALIRCRRPGP